MKSVKKFLKDSKLIWYGVSTLILGLLIYFADVNQFIQALRTVDLFYMSLAMFFGLSVFLVWGYIWHSFFNNLDIEVSFGKALHMFMAGNFMNSITPLGQLGGEPFMAYVVSENTKSSYEKSLSAVMSADLINSIPFIVYATTGFAYLFIYGTLNARIEDVIIIVSALSVFVGAIIYLLWFDRKLLEKWSHGIVDFVGDRLNLTEEFLEPLKEKITEIKDTFESIGEDPRHLLKTATISHLAPVTQFICLYFIMKGLSIEPNFVAIYLTVILSGLAMFSPTPGGSGTYEATFAGLLVLFYPGLGLDKAVASAVLFRLTTYWPGIPIGYYSLIKLKKTRFTG